MCCWVFGGLHWLSCYNSLLSRHKQGTMNSALHNLSQSKILMALVSIVDPGTNPLV